MGKNSKAQEAEMRRQYREARMREEMEKQKRQNRLMWQIVIGVIAVILVVSAVAIAISMGLGKKDASDDTDSTAVAMEDLDFSVVSLEDCTNTETETEYVRMNITYTDKDGISKTGDVVVRLFKEVAPLTVANFQKLVKADHYTGLTFHRVYSGFMIQGGNGDTANRTASSIKGEFKTNGVTNNLSHIRGVISMARTDAPDSASDQFFIMHADSTHLDGSYASFGYVVYGMDTVDGIAATDVEFASGSIDSKPTQPVNPVTINYMTFVTVAKS